MDGPQMEVPGITEGQAEPKAFRLGDEVALEIDSTLYDIGAIYRACYHFTDRLYLFLTRDPDQPQTVLVSFAARSRDADLRVYLGELVNSLLDQQLRCTLEREMAPVRELIVAQAFHEGNLLDPQRDDGDYENDPLGIGEG